MSQLDDAIKEIQDGLGFRVDKVAEITQALQRSQRILEQGKTQPWFLLRTRNLDVVEGETDVAYPGDWNRISRDYKPFYLGSNGLHRIYLREVLGDEGPQLYFPEEDEDLGITGLRAFAILPLTLRFFPVPDQNYEVEFTYYKKADTLGSEHSSNEWTEYAFDALVAHAGLRMANRLRNAEAKAVFQEQWAECSTSLFKQEVLKEDEERPIYAGSVI